MKRDTRVITEVESVSMGAALMMILPRIASLDQNVHTALCAVHERLTHGFEDKDLSPYQVGHVIAQLYLVKQLLDYHAKEARGRLEPSEHQLSEVIEFCLGHLLVAEQAYRNQRR